MSASESLFHIKPDAFDPRRYPQLQAHIQQRMQAIQAQMSQKDNNKDEMLKSIMRAYMALKNVAIEIHTSQAQSKK